MAFAAHILRFWRFMMSTCPFRFHTFSHLIWGYRAVPGGPGRHGWSIDLGVFTVSLDFWNSFSAQFGFGTMDNSLDLWSLVEDLDTTPDTNVMRSLPLPSRPKSAPLQRDHQPPGPRLASPFQVSDLVSRPVSSMGSSGHSTAPRHSGIPRVSDLNQSFSFLPPQPNYRDSIRTSVGSNPLPIPPNKVPVSQSWTAVHRNHELPHPPDPGDHVDSGPQHEGTNPPMHLALHPPKRQQGSMTRFRFPSASPLLGQMWFELLSMLGPLSRIWQETQISPHQRLHLNRLLDNIAPGTAMKYLSSCQSFFRTCKALQVNLGSLTEVQLADILITMSLSRSTSHSSSSCSSVIKALRWLVKAADVGCLQVIHSNIIGSFLNQKIPRDRKQAPPLPLWTLVQWERRILMAQCTVTETILLGTFLVMAWGSLRFSDAQRMDLQKIIYQDATMRGIIWRSKTAVSGMPLAIAAEGFLSKGSHNWVWKFLTVMDDILTQSGLREVDFLLPMLDDQGPIYPLVPMDYATALFYLRKFLGCPWRQRTDPLRDLELNFTLHSLKATFLSWGPQLHEKVTPEQRLSQGHHADPNSSLETYSRDVVWTSLTYQRKMIHEVQAGWRPAIAQHRGSQAPMVEPLVVLEKFVKQVQPFDFRWFTFNAAEDRFPQESIVSSESSSDSSSDSSSEEEVSEPQPKTTKVVLGQPEVDEILVGKYRSVIHALVKADDAEDWRPQWQGHSLKPACGRQMRGVEAEILDRLDTSMPFCQHAACRKVWRACQLLQ